jgi:hypothetical protein
LPEKQQAAKLEKEIVSKADAAPTEKIIKGVADLKSSLSSVLDKLEANMTAEYRKFENLQQAISIERKNIEDLYGIKSQAASFTALILAQKENKEKFEAEILQAQTSFETEMKEKRDAWKKEMEETDRLAKELKAETEKTRKREEDDYKYNLAQERKKEADKHNEKVGIMERQMAEKLANFEKTMAEREAKVLASEKELEELRQKADNFPVELEKAIKTAEKALSLSITNQFEFEKQLNQKQTEGENKLKEQTIQTLSARIKELEQTIKDLNNKVQNADTSVKDIAIKAIESSGKMKIFETVGKKEDRD